jgi:hypothetical protein
MQRDVATWGADLFSERRLPQINLFEVRLIDWKLIIIMWGINLVDLPN